MCRRQRCCARRPEAQRGLYPPRCHCRHRASSRYVRALPLPLPPPQPAAPARVWRCEPPWGASQGCGTSRGVGLGGGSRPGHNVACFMLALCPLCAGDMQSVHYDKRGAKITIGYDGDDCGGKKDEVEQAANKICAENTAMASVRLCMCTRVHAAPCVPDFDCMFAHRVPRPADDASHAHVPTLAPARLK